MAVILMLDTTIQGIITIPTHHQVVQVRHQQYHNQEVKGEDQKDQSEKVDDLEDQLRKRR